MSDSDALKELEERIKPNLGNPELLPVYRKEADRLRELTDADLVYIERVDPGRAAAAELTRRTMEATRELNRSLDSANTRIYWLTAILTIYTVVLVVATVFLALKAH